MFGRRSDRDKKEQVRSLGKAVLALVLSTSLVMNSVAPATMVLADTAGEAVVTQTTEAQDGTTSTDDATNPGSTEEANSEGTVTEGQDNTSSSDAKTTGETDTDSADEDPISTNQVLAAAPMAAPVLRAPAADAVRVVISTSINRWYDQMSSTNENVPRR